MTYRKIAHINQKAPGELRRFSNLGFLGGFGYRSKNPLVRLIEPSSSTIEARTALPTAPLFLTLGLGLVPVAGKQAWRHFDDTLFGFGARHRTVTAVDSTMLVSSSRRPAPVSRLSLPWAPCLLIKKINKRVVVGGSSQFGLRRAAHRPTCAIYLFAAYVVRVFLRFFFV